MKVQRLSDSMDTNVELTPLIDVVFLLLIFFMVSIGFNSVLGIISLIVLPMVNRGGEKQSG